MGVVRNRAPPAQQLHRRNRLRCPPGKLQSTEGLHLPGEACSSQQGSNPPSPAALPWKQATVHTACRRQNWHRQPCPPTPGTCALTADRCCRHSSTKRGVARAAAPPSLPQAPHRLAKVICTELQGYCASSGPFIFSCLPFSQPDSEVRKQVRM